MVFLIEPLTMDAVRLSRSLFPVPIQLSSPPQPSHAWEKILAAQCVHSTELVSCFLDMNVHDLVPSKMNHVDKVINLNAMNLGSCPTIKSYLENCLGMHMFME